MVSQVLVGLLGLVLVQDAGDSPPAASDAPPPVPNLLNVADAVAIVRTDDDVALHVRVMGEGDPVLLLTGGPGFSGGYLEPVAEHVSKTHTAILPDQRGTGESGPDPFDATAFGIERSVADLEQIRVSLGHDTLTVVGHSWGGILAMHYAAAHPDRVSNLVLLNSGGVDPSFMRGYQANISARMTDEDRAALAKIVPAEQTIEAYADAVRAANRAMAGGMTATPQAAAELRDTWMTPEQFDARVAIIMQRPLAAYDLKPTLGAYQGPATVVHGELDPIGIDTAEVIAATLPNAELVTIEGAAHWPFIEAPGAFYKVLDGALTRD